MYAPLSNSYQWSVFNKDGNITKLVQTVIEKGESVDFKRMPIVHSRLRNRDKSPLLPKIEDAVENGDLVMAYIDNNSVRIPLYLPFILMQGKGRMPRALVFLNVIGASAGDDGIFVDDRRLKVSLESAYMAMMFVYNQNSRALVAPNLIRPSAKVYSGIVSECINRKHSIKLSPDVYNGIIYILNRYFIGTVMGCKANDDIMESYCLYNIMNPDLVGIRKIADAFQPEDYANIATVIQKMAVVPELKGRVGKLTVSGFIESYINMYDSTMLLALENYSYFIYNILSVRESTYVNNYQALKGIVGKDGNSIYANIVTNICGV